MQYAIEEANYANVFRDQNLSLWQNWKEINIDKVKFGIVNVEKGRTFDKMTDQVSRGNSASAKQATASLPKFSFTTRVREE